MLEVLSDTFDFFISTIQKFNSLIFTHLSGIILVIAVCVTVAAYRKVSKIEANQDAMHRLADAIIKQHNKELKESR